LSCQIAFSFYREKRPFHGGRSGRVAYVGRHAVVVGRTCDGRHGQQSAAVRVRRYRFDVLELGLDDRMAQVRGQGRNRLRSGGQAADHARSHLLVGSAP